MRALVLFFCLLVAPVWAQDEISQISYWSDAYGNQGSFWKLVVKGKTFVALKLKSTDKAGEANVALDQSLLSELEQRAAELKSTPNNLKSDGYQVVWSRESGNSRVSTLLGRWHGIKLKLIQVHENKNGESEHQISLDKGYSDFQRALKKAKPILSL